jgi:hypothetical protein
MGNGEEEESTMKNGIIPGALVILVTALAALAQQGSVPSVRQDGNLVQVQASEAFLNLVTEGQPLRLTLVDPKLGQTSVVGTPRRRQKNGLALTTNASLGFLPEKGTRVILSAESADPASCLPPEVGVDCVGTFCVGTTYCLPSEEAGGIVCSCE